MKTTNWTYIDNRVKEGLNKSSTYDEWKKNAPNPTEIEKDLKLYQSLRRAGLNEYVRKVHKKEKHNPFVAFFRNKKAVSVAAGVVVLLTAGLLVWNLNQSKSDSIAVDNPKKDSTESVDVPSVSELGIDDILANQLGNPIENVPSKFQGVVNRINQGESSKAINELLAMNVAKPVQTEGDDNFFGASGEKSIETGQTLSREEKVYQNLYLGIAYLKKADYKNAKNQLVKVSTTEAKWYLALAYLGEKNIDKTIELAKQVESTHNDVLSGKATLLINNLQTYEK